MVERRHTQPSVQIGGAGTVPRIQFATGNVRLLKRFADGMSGLANEFHNQADAEAQASARDQGAIAGESGNAELQSYGTIRGLAYNQAAIQSFMSTLETNSLLKYSELEAEHRNNPAALGKALQDYRKGASEELRKLSPTAAQAFEQSMTNREIAAVERQRDSRYNVIKDQANAGLISNKMALEADIKLSAGDLFSNNPALSQAASSNINLMKTQLMRVYSATDPDGKPLYTATQKAQAEADFNEMVFKNAAVSWFNQQDDKVSAYEQFTNGDWTIQLETPGLGEFGDDISQYLEGNATRNHDGMKPTFRRRFASFMAHAPEDIQGGLKIFSGHRSIAEQRILWKRALREHGTAREARKWVAPPGNSRHNHGDAGDLRYNGQPLTSAPPEVQKWVHDNAPKHGLHFRLSNEPWHIETDPSFEEKGEASSIDVRKTLSEAAVAAIGAEMRAQISHENQIEDREVRLAEEDLAAEQEINQFTFVDQIAKGEPVRQDMISGAVANRDISASMGIALTNALKVSNAGTDDRAVHDRLILKMYNNEDAQIDILNAKGSLKPETFRMLLERNRLINGGGEELAGNDKVFLMQLKDALSPDSMLGSFDDGAEMRKFNALTEYRARVEEGEKPEEVSRDILDRANRELIAGIKVKLNGKLRPRYSVLQEGGFIDLDQSILALNTAKNANQIGEDAFLRQVKLLQEWKDAQDAIVRGQAAKGTK